MKKVTSIVILGALGAFVGAYATGGFNAWLPQEMKVGVSSASLLGDGDVALKEQDTRLEDKLQPVIGCLNDVASPLRDRAQTYVNEYPHLAATPGATRIAASFKIQVYEQNNSISRECIAALRGAIAMTPADAGLDDPGKIFADTLEQLIPVMNEVDLYYSRKDNIDDHMKKGGALNEQIMPLFTMLFDAEDKLREIVSERNHTLREKRLVAIEQAFGTENFGWHTLNVSLSARRAIDGISNLAETGQLDTQSIEKVEQAYQAALDKADAFAKAHPDTRTKLGNTPKWFALSSDFNTFLVGLKDFRRLLAGNPDQQAIEAQLSKLQGDYNSMIRSYNMIPDV
ncbi:MULTISPECIES: DUF3829 domain-containing protein [unclassified Shinella]|uniref:DUF3829 domain-containing protein n=1 Tax=unclassified Shinella TaxID=2643062 RepID=UPI0009EB8A31|nr:MULTISPECIES: DUF3829 domain-containing protein [unclassified Shinella]